MKKLSILALLVCLLAPTSVLALSGTTNSGFAGCRSKAWFDDFIGFVVANDDASMSSYLASGKCQSIPGGVKVTVLESPGVFGSTVVIALRGVKLWTVREAVGDYKP